MFVGARDCNSLQLISLEQTKEIARRYGWISQCAFLCHRLFLCCYSYFVLHNILDTHPVNFAPPTATSISETQTCAISGRSKIDYPWPPQEPEDYRSFFRYLRRLDQAHILLLIICIHISLAIEPYGGLILASVLAYTSLILRRCIGKLFFTMDHAALKSYVWYHFLREKLLSPQYTAMQQLRWFCGSDKALQDLLLEMIRSCDFPVPLLPEWYRIVGSAFRSS